MNIEIAKTALSLIKDNETLIDDMPNINFPTMGGNIWWRDLARVDGWRIQQNSVTKHCRILDPYDVRRAWGSESGMENLFNKIVNGNR